MKINVTKADIMYGRRKSAHRCPVALAIKRVCPIEMADDILVVDAYLFTEAPGGTTAHPMPWEVSSRIDAYDEGEPMEPFSFELPDDVFEEEEDER